MIMRGTEVRFRAGDLVRHVRYGYRGVVVEADSTCRASEAWYQKNQTQPNRQQPWYHVLVDGTDQTTYAAQTSLEPDPSEEPIAHPFVPLFFDGMKAGRYERNQRPWPPSA